MEAVSLHKSERLGFLKWETRVETPRTTWYFTCWTKHGSERQAMAHFKELTRDERERGTTRSS